MQNVNFISQGRLTRDPDFKTLENGTPIVKFTIAIDRYKGQGERETDFLDCVAWRQLAEVIHTHFKKGDPILVYGQMKSRRYVNSEGVNVTRWDLEVSGFQFVLSNPRRETNGVRDVGEEGEQTTVQEEESVNEDPFA